MKNLYLQLALAIIFFSSCAPTYYKPKTVNVPLLESNKDLQLSGHFDPESFSIQGAYAVDDNVGLSLDIFRYSNTNRNHGPNIPTSKSSSKYNSIELGIGHFKQLNNRFHFEVYGFAGLGSLEKFSNAQPTEYNTPANGTINSNYTLIGLQPSIGVKWKYFEFAYSLRLLRIKYGDAHGDYTWQGASEIDYLNRLGRQYLGEQAFTFRAGLENVKFQFQLVKSDEIRIGFNDSIISRNPFEGGRASIGIVCNF